MDAAIDACAEDVEEDGGIISVTTAMEDLHAVSSALSEAGLPVTSTELVQMPSTTINVEKSDALTLMKLITNMDDLDDVSQVSANFDIDDEIMAEIEDKL
jgi:transcriptional/translational regulatory protein YebC/TACO1